jgi:hypothetical protein
MPDAVWAARLRVTMHEPRSGRVVDGRGGIAVAPGRAVRLILVGAAGATWLDAWVTPEEWRVAVPPLGLVRRGGQEAPSELPVSFLRWWFFRPFEGRLFAATPGPPEPAWLLRDRDAVVEVHLPVGGAEVRGPACDGGWIEASRRVSGRSERILACGAGVGGAAPGERVRYLDEATRLVVEIVVEALASEPPAAEAFADPDRAPTHE